MLLATSDYSLGMIVLYAIIGQFLVFVVIAILLGLLHLVRLCISLFAGEKKKAANNVADNVEVGGNSLENQNVAVNADMSDEEVVAVIGAVIAVCCNEVQNGKTAPFKVKKIYKLN